MRIMVIGQQAAGKTFFAKKLGEKLSIPVIHLDAIVNGQGRDKRLAGDFIRQRAEEPDWIMDGNAFTSDRMARLEKADYIFLFTSHPVISLARHMRRWIKHESGDDGRTDGLYLGFVISFIFVRWPAREREIIEDARRLNKKLICVPSRKAANNYLETLRFLQSAE